MAQDERIETIAMIHQPHFLPWEGYIARMLRADVVVLLDSVDFKKNYFQNRTRIVGADGAPHWLTLPVARPHHRVAIRAIEVRLNRPQWSKIRRQVESAYGSQPYYAETWGEVLDIVEDSLPSLLEVNRSTLGLVLERLRPGRDKDSLLLASEISDARDRTQRLIEICRATGADGLVLGYQATATHDMARLRKSGITPVRQVHASQLTDHWRPQLTYPMAGLSALDTAARVGWSGLLISLSSGWHFDSRGE